MAAGIREVVSNSLLYTATGKVNTVSTSAAVQVTDVLLCIYMLDYGQLDQAQGPTPGGWISQAVSTSAGAAPYTRAWTSKVTTAGVQTVSITQTDQYTDSNLILAVLTGANADTPIDVAATGMGSSATAHIAPNVATSYADELVIFAWGSGINTGDTGTYAMPSGVTALASVASAPYSTLAVGYQTKAAPGGVGAKTATFTRSTSPTTAVAYAALTLAIRTVSPAPGDAVSSALGITNTVTASKAAAVAVTSRTGVTASSVPAKAVTAGVSSAIGVTTLVGEAPDVRSIPAGGPLDISIWALDLARNYLAPLPDYTKITISPVVNGPGSISIDYPADGLNWALLHDIILGNRDTEIAVWLGGRDEGSLRAVILEGSGDEVEEQAVWTFAGCFLEYRMSDAVVHPDPTDPTGQQQVHFADQTAGAIMAGLMGAAQDRGALTDIGFDSFTATTDSTGRTFSTTATMLVAAGADYMALLGTLTDIGLCEWEVTADHHLRLYEPYTRGVDRATTVPPMIVRAARDITEAPRKYSIRDAATAMIAVGGNGLNAIVSDPVSLARRGRRVERYVSQNQIVDSGALDAYAQAQLGSLEHGKMELTHGLTFALGGPLPVADFALGDWVYSDNGNGLERLRVQQWTITQDDKGTLGGSVTLGDLIDQVDLQLANRLNAIASGTVVVGTSTPGPTATNDAKTPATPTGLVCSSLIYTDIGPPAQTAASVFCGWSAVTLNTDGTAVTAGGLTYRLRYRYTDAPASSASPLPEGWAGTDDGLPWLEGGSGSTVTLQFSGLSPDRPIEVQVAAVLAVDPSTQPYEVDSLNRAFRRTELQSPWSPGVDLTTAADTTAPPAPAMPTATTGPGAIARIVWDGLAADAVDATPLSVEAPDFAYVEVHVSPTSNFAPDATTFTDRLYGPGTTVASNLLYQVGYFARLVAVDQSGNASAPSDQAAFTPHELLSADLFAGCVGSAQLAYAAVKNANIDMLAVNAAQIASVNAGAITSGIGTFDLLLAGRIRTAATGPRIELDSTSFRQYGPDGSTLSTQLISATGEALITGLIRSALVGKRWEMNPDGTLRLYPSSGLNYSAIFNNSTSGTNELVMRGQLDGSGNSGYLRVNATGIAAQFGIPGQSVQAQLSVKTANIDATAPVVGLRADHRFAAADGLGQRVVMVHNDSTGADIDSSAVNHLYPISGDSKSTGFWHAKSGVALVFNGQAGSSNGSRSRIQLIYNNGSYPVADFQCGWIDATGGSIPSDVSLKTDIQDLQHDPLEVIRGSRSKAWRYKHELIDYQPTEPIPRRRLKPGRPADGGRLGDFEYVHVDPVTGEEVDPAKATRGGSPRRIDPESVPLHVGPIAQDIEKVAPHLILGVDGDKKVSFTDMIGYLWGAVADLADKVDELTDRFADVPELPGRTRHPDKT